MWTPEIARLYGIRPWEMHRVNVRELGLMRRHVERMTREMEGG